MNSNDLRNLISAYAKIENMDASAEESLFTDMLMLYVNDIVEFNYEYNLIESIVER